jgi:hypothetical protein
VGFKLSPVLASLARCEICGLRSIGHCALSSSGEMEIEARSTTANIGLSKPLCRRCKTAQRARLTVGGQKPINLTLKRDLPNWPKLHNSRDISVKRVEAKLR